MTNNRIATWEDGWEPGIPTPTRTYILTLVATTVAPLSAEQQAGLKELADTVGDEWQNGCAAFDVGAGVDGRFA